jgi:hypothetical protein
MILSGAADRVWPMWQTGLFCYALLAKQTACEWAMEWIVCLG